MHGTAVVFECKIARRKETNYIWSLDLPANSVLFYKYSFTFLINKINNFCSLQQRCYIITSIVIQWLLYALRLGFSLSGERQAALSYIIFASDNTNASPEHFQSKFH